MDRSHKWVNQPVGKLPNTKPRLIILIRRGLETIIPTGGTVIRPGDILVVAEPEEDG